MTLDFFIILSFFVTLLAVANVVLYLKRYSSQNMAFRYFTINILLVSLIQVSALILGKILHEPNLFLSHAYMAVQFGFLSLFYASLLKANWIKYVCGVVFLILIAQYFVDPSLFLKYNPIGMSITHAVLVSYAVLYFYRSLNKTKEFIIVNVAIFIYLLSSTLIFASGNLVLGLNISKETKFLLINVNRVLTLVFQILVFVEWYRNYRTKKSLTN